MVVDKRCRGNRIRSAMHDPFLGSRRQRSGFAWSGTILALLATAEVKSPRYSPQKRGGSRGKTPQAHRQGQSPVRPPPQPLRRGVAWKNPRGLFQKALPAVSVDPPPKTGGPGVCV